jgi:hypothetical protein
MLAYIIHPLRYMLPVPVKLMVNEALDKFLQIILQDAIAVR